MKLQGDQVKSFSKAKTLDMLVDLGRNYKYTAIINPTQPRYLGRKHMIAKTKPDKIISQVNFATVCCIRTKQKLLSQGRVAGAGVSKLFGGKQI